MKHPNRLKELRKLQGLTQKQVAHSLGKQCEDRVSEWEHGKSMPGVLNLVRLSEILKVSIDDIYPSLSKNSLD